MRPCGLDETGSDFSQPEFMFTAIKFVFITVGVFKNN
jgi:hypothetical protein